MTLTRRAFIRISAMGGALVVSFGRPLHAIGKNAVPVRLNPWIRVKPDGVVEIVVSQAEMGQGVHTTLPAIIADEMDADWARVELVMSPVGKAYVNPRFGTQFTGNAESVRTFWPHLRRLGATARDVLVRAAARRWGVPASACRTENGRVLHRKKALSYGELATHAARITPRKDPPLKTPAEWKLLRKSLPRTDLRDKVTGAPIFGIDIERPDMLYATVLHCPVHGGRFRSVDLSGAKKSPGVKAVLRVPGRKILGKGCEAVVVVADRWWRARKALERIEYEVEGPDFSTDDLSTTKVLSQEAWTVVETKGPGGPASGPASAPAASGAHTLSAAYTSAWQAHAPMEPMNCTAEVKGDRCTLWAPTQGQTMCVTEVSEALGIPAENVEVNRTFLGGGFGRRLIADYGVQAALASRAVGGRPVKLIWTREQDIRHDHYRPEVTVRLAAELDERGHPTALQADVVSASILSAVISFRPPFRHPEADPSCLEGLTAQEGLRYGIGRYTLRSHLQELPVGTMVWRTTGYGPNAFALECFIDELAAHAQADPIDYRRRLLERKPDNDRAIAVLERLREVSGWTDGGKGPSGRAQGVALSYCFETFIGQVVEVSVSSSGVLDLHRVVTVLDGGYVLDPGITQANIQGGIVWGLSQALTSQITFSKGRVDQSNFHDFEILELRECPKTEFHFIDSGAHPGGLGEVGPVPTAPALVNAIATATGRRVRRLPLRAHGIQTRFRARGKGTDA